MPQTLTRQQLHARVWQQPMTKLAKEFGVSDVALHKICRKLDVPTPPAGYWTKKAFGKAVTETPLPNPSDQREVVMRESSASNEPEAMAEARAAVLEALQRGGDEPVGDAILERTVAKLRKAKKDREGLVRTDGASVVHVVVRQESVERAIEALQYLVARAHSAGVKLVQTAAGAAWLYDSETIGFELLEAADQVEHVTTDKELAAVEKWRREREQTHQRYGYWSNYGEPKIPKWERRYQGRLMLRLEEVRLKTERSWWGEAITRTFSETRVRKLERAVTNIIATVAAMAAAKRSNAAFEERQRLAELEAARRRAEAERRRQQEQKAVALLDQLLEQQARIDRLRALLAALDGTNHDGRVERFRSWVEARLHGMELSFAREGLEERLAGDGLFDAVSVVD